MAASAAARRQQGTRLAIIVVVDQLRADLLDRYDALFTGGFRRLRDQGFRFTNATHDHWWTETAPGHTAISTGAYPAHHGITLNTFAVPDTNRLLSVYSFADSTSPILGLPDRPGRSPANMRRPAFAEWLVAHVPRARVATVSRKDRGAIPLAGRTRAAAFWIDIESGRFVTSAWYAREIPAWVTEFNAGVMPSLYADSVWTLAVPPAGRALARRDSAAYENGGLDVTFPHAAAERPASQSRNAWVAETPVPDLATLLLARRMVEELRLGRRADVDFLGVSLSQADAIGHKWGPLSLEQLDNLLRLDRALGEFLAWLDEFVGPDRWLLALSADHGVMTAPEYLRELGTEAFRLTSEQARVPRSLLARLADTTTAVARAEVIGQIEALPWVSDVVTVAELRSTGAPSDSFLPLLRNAWAPDRSAGTTLSTGLVVRNRPNVTSATSDAGTHGSPYHYDRHVPLVFLGPGIPNGLSEARVGTVDLAPTLASLIGVPIPAGIDGVSRASLLRR
jgi:predicted AlkP superfamily pyrophosphatase or phosphodiesterase